MRCFQVLFVVFICNWPQTQVAFAEDFPFEAELKMVRKYFQSVSPVELADVQADLASIGVYHRAIDGIWGPGTENAIRGQLKIYILIGGIGPDWGIRSPSDTPRFRTWIRQVEGSFSRGTEYPD